MLVGLSAFPVARLRRHVQGHHDGVFAEGAPTDVVREIAGWGPEYVATTTRRYALRTGTDHGFTAKGRAMYNCSGASRPRYRVVLEAGQFLTRRS